MLIFIICFHLREFTTRQSFQPTGNELHMSFIRSDWTFWDGYTENNMPKTENEDFYNNKTFDNQNKPIYITTRNVYVTNSIFIQCTNSGEGGAVYYSKTSGKILVEFSTFGECYSTSSGGAICVYNSDCVMYCVCCYGCYATSTGQFIRNAWYDGLNYINSSSVCSSSSSGSRTMDINYGEQICTFVNISNNHVSERSAIHFDDSIFISYITYCSINSNYASMGYCVWLYVQGSKSYVIDKCNIINNEQHSTSYPVIYCWKNTEIKNCCILNNKAINNTKCPLFGISSGCKLTLIHCHCQNITKTSNGIINTNNITTNEFINYLKFTETEKGCLSGIDQVDGLIPNEVRINKHTYENFNCNIKLIFILSAYLVLLKVFL